MTLYPPEAIYLSICFLFYFYISYHAYIIRASSVLFLFWDVGLLQQDGIGWIRYGTAQDEKKRKEMKIGKICYGVRVNELCYRFLISLCLCPCLFFFFHLFYDRWDSWDFHCLLHTDVYYYYTPVLSYNFGLFWSFFFIWTHYPFPYVLCTMLGSLCLYSSDKGTVILS